MYGIRELWFKHRFGPLQFFLGRQIVTWGESIFGYRVGDQINPRDVSWNFGFANPEQSYMPLWMIHPILNLPSVGPFSSNFAELVYIPGIDFMYTQVDYPMIVSTVRTISRGVWASAPLVRAAASRDSLTAARFLRQVLRIRPGPR